MGESPQHPGTAPAAASQESLQDFRNFLRWMCEDASVGDISGATGPNTADDTDMLTECVGGATRNRPAIETGKLSVGPSSSCPICGPPDAHVTIGVKRPRSAPVGAGLRSDAPSVTSNPRKLTARRWVLQEYDSRQFARSLADSDMEALLRLAGFRDPAAPSPSAAAPTAEDTFADFQALFSTVLDCLEDVRELWNLERPCLINGFGADSSCVAEALAGQPAGTFVCRPFATCPHSLAVSIKVDGHSWQANDEEVKDSIQHIEIALRNQSGGSVACADVRRSIFELQRATHAYDLCTRWRVDKRSILAPPCVPINGLMSVIQTDWGPHDPALGDPSLKRSRDPFGVVWQHVREWIEGAVTQRQLSRWPPSAAEQASLRSWAGFPPSAPPSTTVPREQYADFQARLSGALDLMQKLDGVAGLWPQRHACIICGLGVENTKAEEALDRQPAGTFVCHVAPHLSFSGLLVLSCKMPEGSVDAPGNVIHFSVDARNLEQSEIKSLIYNQHCLTHVLDVYTKERWDKRLTAPN